MASRPFADHFSERSDLYARYRPHYPEALAAALAEAAGGRNAVWEAGCGSGQLTRVLARVFLQVHATDASAAQLEHAPALPAVRWAVEDAGACSLAADSVDLAVAAQAAHWFPMSAYVAEIRRVVRPGGAAALISYDRLSVDPDVDRVVRTFQTETLAGSWPPERRHVFDGYRSLPFPFAPVSVPPLAMEMEWGREDLLGYVASWSGTRRLLAAGNEPDFDSFCQHVRRLWPDGEVRRVRWPLLLRVGRVE